MIRITWDKYETAILIEASLKIINKEISRKDGIFEVSNTLRQRAINNGIQIDDKFRNVNGISMQIAMMISLVQEQDSPLHNYSKLFTEMVALYKNDKTSFYSILHQAKKEAGLSENLYYIVDTEGETDVERYEETTSKNELQQYIEILKNRFPRGFRLNDSLDVKKFRRYWNEQYKEELTLDNETIWENIRNITISHGNLSYLPDTMLEQSLKEEILNYIFESFNKDVVAIYYDALYQMFKEKLDSSRINNTEMLITYLKYINDGRYIMRRSCLTKDEDIKIDVSDEVRQYLISCNQPVKTNDIIEKLSHIDGDKIRWALSGHNSYEFVRNKKGEYLHADIVMLTDSELNRIESWISSSIAENDYMGGKELVDLVKTKLPEVFDKYPYLTDLGLRDVIAYKLKEKFSFKSKIISKLGEELKMEKVFAEYALNNVPFTLNQLVSLATDLGTTIYWWSVYENAMRINKNDFVSRNEANFNISATDDAIEQFCSGDFISIKDITLFGGFPDCNFSWNSFLLEYFVMFYSDRFKLLHTMFNKSKPVGAIVRRNSNIETFDDLIIVALAQSNIALNTDNALDYLCESGYLARRSYGNIDVIVNKAKAYRATKGD